MNRIIPYFILSAFIIAFVFGYTVWAIIFAFAFFFDLANTYSNVKNKVIYATQYRITLAQMFFWNRMVKNRIGFFFDLKDIELNGEMTLGGIYFSHNYIALRYEFDEDQQPYFSLCTISDIDGVEYIGKPYHLTKDIRYVSLHFSHQLVQTVMGPRWFIMYWVITDAGEKILYGKIQTKKSRWTIILPDKMNTGLTMEIHA